MSRQTKYLPELRERAIRMVYEQREHHESQSAAIESVAQKIGCTAQTLRNRIAKTGVRAFSTRRQKLSLSSRGLYCAVKTLSADIHSSYIIETSRHPRKLGSPHMHNLTLTVLKSKHV